MLRGGGDSLLAIVVATWCARTSNRVRPFKVSCAFRRLLPRRLERRLAMAVSAYGSSATLRQPPGAFAPRADASSFHRLSIPPEQPMPDPTVPTYSRIAPDVTLGRGVILHGFVNLYGCRVGDHTRIGTFVEVQKNAVIGARCKLSSHTFVCEGVTIEDDVFIGHGVMFINDRDPRATIAGRPQSEADWTLEPTRVCRGASIGSGAVIMAGVTIGEGACGWSRGRR